MRRRRFLELLSAASVTGFVRPAGAGARTVPTAGAFGFREVAALVDATHHLPAGYRAQVLRRWGDPLHPDLPDWRPGEADAALQARRFGYNNDFLAYFPLPMSRVGEGRASTSAQPHPPGCADPRERANHARYGVGAEAWYPWWAAHDPHFDIAHDARAANGYGWVVEINPRDPQALPVKRTALGRFRHEAATCALAPDGRVCVYSGDDAPFEYLYRFVSARPYSPNGANWHLLDEGTLFVARFAGDPPAAPADGARYPAPVSASGWLTAPDNCALDPAGRLWIATDQGRRWRGTGRADGLYGCTLDGPARGALRCLFRAPVGAEVCGPEFTPDGRTLFLAVQHPGIAGFQDGSYGRPGTRWPDFDDDVPPRPSVLAITREDGGIIGD